MKIIFLGTPEFAVPSLDILVKNGYDNVAVVTASAKKAGRGLQLKQPAIKEYADKAGIKTFQPEKFSDPVFLKEILSLSADLFIVVAFRMLPEALWKMPPLGTFNLHSSLLPQYRGAAPINRVIMNGEKETGVTTFFLKHEIDTGNIILQEKIAILPDETAGELHDRLKISGAELLLKTVQAIENNSVETLNQEVLINEPLKAAPKIFPEDCRINWSAKCENIHNQVRGLSPFPGAFTTIENKTGEKLILKIYRSSKSNFNSDLIPGKISVENNSLYIDCFDYRLEILEVQLEGKKRIQVAEFLKGFRLEKEWKALW
jgi:methionyl-tRNA formyltransferase